MFLITRKVHYKPSKKQRIGIVGWWVLFWLVCYVAVCIGLYLGGLI